MTAPTSRLLLSLSLTALCLAAACNKTEETAAPPTQAPQSFGREVGEHLQGAINSAQDAQDKLNAQASRTEETFKQLQQPGQPAGQSEHER